MKKIMIALAALACLFAFTAAHAADTPADATLYKSHCQGCHGEDGSRAPSNGVEPIKGQRAADLQKKLAGYKDGSFGGKAKQVMEGVVKQLSDDQLKSVADYAATL